MKAEKIRRHSKNFEVLKREVQLIKWQERALVFCAGALACCSLLFFIN